MTQSWQGMEDSYLKIPKHFLFGGCMYSTWVVCVVENGFGATFFPILSSKIETKKFAPHTLSIHISPCPTSFRPLPCGLKLVSKKTHAPSGVPLLNPLP